MNVNEKCLSSIDHLLHEFVKEFNSSGVLRDIATYWGFRSTVPGPGLSAASAFLHQRYLDYGIQAGIREYPADDRTEYLDGRKNPLAWTPRSARLEILSPQKYIGIICSYEQEPLCLISNSTATPPEGVEFEVVLLHSGVKEKDYSGTDIHGKVILTDTWPLQVDALARKHGAMGIISDGVTPPWLKNYPPVRLAADVPDLTMWGVLDGHRNRKPLWGFSLTPRQGARLRQILREAKEPVKLRAFVDAELKEGVSEVVEAIIPGSDKDSGEIWLLAHSSEPGALDNASGCCASIEIARCLVKLVLDGRLPKPKRSIRFLHAVEVGGFVPMVTELLYQGKNRGLEQVKAAIAFDSIGQDFRKGGGSLRVFRSPEANPAFTDSLLGELVARVSHIPAETFGSDAYEPFFWQIDPHFPGNDNFLGDGFFDIPTPMLCDWPDKHYHSNLDTVDKLSTGSMGKACVAAAVYLVLLASTDPESARWMADLTLRDYKKQIVEEPENVEKLYMQGKDALRSMLRLGDIREIVDERVRSLEDFATREGNVVNRRVEEETGKPGQINKDHWIKPKRWKFPATKNLSSEGRTRLRAM